MKTGLLVSGMLRAGNGPTHLHGHAHGEDSTRQVDVGCRELRDKTWHRIVPNENTLRTP